MKQPLSKITIISSFLFLLFLMIFGLIYNVIREKHFYSSGFSKKVQKIECFRSGGVNAINIDCIYFTDGKSTCFSTYSIIDKNDTLRDVRVIDFISVGDSVIKQKEEPFIRVVRK